MLNKLNADNVNITKDAEDYEGVGRFAWIEDLEGNRVELWEPEGQTN